MDFGLSTEQKTFREDVRAFLAAEENRGFLGNNQNSWIEGFSQEFSKKISKMGWIGLTWPKKFGGQGKGYVDRLIFVEEMLRVQAPIAFHFMADRQVGPALIHFGNEELKQYFLPRIINADISFCLMFSEPQAGSDLSAVRTTAVESGDHFVLNGQKVWTSNGHRADFGWVLARSNPDNAVPSHKSMSEFILDMKSPGVDIRPIINMAGVHSFNEVFLEDVKVHKQRLVGEKDAGFYQIMKQMVFERAGIERLMQNYPLKTSLVDYVKNTTRNGKLLSDDTMVRNALADLEIEFNVGRLLCYNLAWIIDQGKSPNYEASVCKVFCTNFERKLADTATKIMGLYGQLTPDCKYAPYQGIASDSYLWNFSYTLQGGAVEILKNIIALRGLNLRTK